MKEMADQQMLVPMPLGEYSIHPSFLPKER
jgi:hypothetical protein